MKNEQKIEIQNVKTVEIIKIDNSILLHISSQHSANYLYEGNYHIINKYTDNMKRMIFWDKGYFVEVKSSIHLQTWKFHSKSGKMRNKAEKIKNGNVPSPLDTGTQVPNIGTGKKMT